MIPNAFLCRKYDAHYSHIDYKIIVYVDLPNDFMTRFMLVLYQKKNDGFTVQKLSYIHLNYIGQIQVLFYFISVFRILWLNTKNGYFFSGLVKNYR